LAISQGGFLAFDHELPFHLGQGCQYVKEEAPGDRSGIDRVGEADEAYAAVIQAAGVLPLKVKVKVGFLSRDPPDIAPRKIIVRSKL
jgi:hypothetical protein